MDPDASPKPSAPTPLASRIHWERVLGPGRAFLNSMGRPTRIEFSLVHLPVYIGPDLGRGEPVASLREAHGRPGTARMTSSPSIARAQSRRHMFPSLRRGEAKRRRGAFDPAPLLSSLRPERPLVAVLDVDSYAPSQVDELLLGLFGHHDARLWRYSQNGPPPTLPRYSHEFLGETVEGWLVVEATERPEPSWKVTYQSDDRVQSCTVRLSSGAIALLSWDRGRLNAYPDLSASVASERMREDLLILHAAEAAGADLLITTRRYLLHPDRGLAASCRTTPMEARDAIPLVGLFFRRYGEFLYSKTATREHKGSAGGWYRDGALALFSSLGPWLNDIETRTEDSRGSDLRHLALTTFDRLARVLRARDGVHIALNSPVSDEAAEEAMTAVDDLAVATQAALDASARVCAALLNLDIDRFGLSWRRQKLIDALRGHAGGQALADLATSAPHKHVLGLVAGLRNTVHGAGLVGIRVKDPAGGDVTTAAVLPPDAADRVMESVDALGGPAAFGIRRTAADEILVDPGLTVERLLANLVPLVDQLFSNMIEPAKEPTRDLRRGFELPEHVRGALLAQLAVGDEAVWS